MADHSDAGDTEAKKSRGRPKKAEMKVHKETITNLSEVTQECR